MRNFSHSLGKHGLAPEMLGERRRNGGQGPAAPRHDSGCDDYCGAAFEEVRRKCARSTHGRDQEPRPDDGREGIRHHTCRAPVPSNMIGGNVKTVPSDVGKWRYTVEAIVYDANLDAAKGSGDAQIAHHRSIRPSRPGREALDLHREGAFSRAKHVRHSRGERKTRRHDS